MSRPTIDIWSGRMNGFSCAVKTVECDKLDVNKRFSIQIRPARWKIPQTIKNLIQMMVSEWKAKLEIRHGLQAERTHIRGVWCNQGSKIKALCWRIDNNLLDEPTVDTLKRRSSIYRYMDKITANHHMKLPNNWTLWYSSTSTTNAPDEMSTVM